MADDKCAENSFQESSWQHLLEKIQTFMGNRETNIARGKATRLHWSTGKALVKNHVRRFLKHDSSQVGVAPPQDPSAMGLRSPLVDQ